MLMSTSDTIPASRASESAVTFVMSDAVPEAIIAIDEDQRQVSQKKANEQRERNEADPISTIVPCDLKPISSRRSMMTKNLKR